MTGIYKITNLINNKVYIGQAYDIVRRLGVHKRGAGSDTQIIDKAILKYGQDNFSYEVIEECPVEKLNEREIYWINYYNSYEKGYNCTIGGQGTSNAVVMLSLEDVKEIYQLLLGYELSQKEIAKKFNVCEETITNINRGKSRILEGYAFPLRKIPLQTVEAKVKQGVERSDIINNIEEFEHNREFCKCGKPKTKQAEMCEECYRKSTRVAERPSRDELLEQVALNGFVAVGKKYGVSDNAIRKWCDAYDLPKYIKEVKVLYKKEKGIVEKTKKVVYPVEQYHPVTGELLNVYPSAMAASRALGKLSGTHISEVCNGKGKTAHGFVWKYRK